MKADKEMCDEVFSRPGIFDEENWLEELESSTNDDAEKAEESRKEEEAETEQNGGTTTPPGAEVTTPETLA